MASAAIVHHSCVRLMLDTACIKAVYHTRTRRQLPDKNLVY
eukprot:SAG31_NODE_15634_length_745_cov_1.190402_1_plen_40_part_01